MKKETTYLILLTAIYFVVSFVGILHHELWLDEAHHYLLARDSNSFIELIQNTRYEGHPILWNTLLYGLTRFTLNPFWMQFLHILISTMVVFLFLRKAPFNWTFKALFIFGYFMIFEYNLISRNYILGVLFLFLACSVFEKRKEKFVLLCVYLALASNVHLMFSVIAFALFLSILYENNQSRQLFSKQYNIGYFIFGLGVLTLGIQLQTTDSNWFFNSISEIPLPEKGSKGMISLFKGLVVIPDFRAEQFWNLNYIVNLNRPLASALGLFIYLVPLILFFKSKKTLFFVYLALIGTQIFFFITLRAATRFHGMTYIIMIMALWIEHYYASDSYKLKTILDRFKVAIIQKPIVYGILLIHLCSGITAYAMDYSRPFASSKETVDFIKEKHLNILPIISLTCDGTTISSYLEKKVWFLCNQSYQGYCRWNFDCAEKINQAEVQQMVCNFMTDYNQAVYVSYFPLTDHPKRNVWVNLNKEVKVRFLENFDRAYIVKGNYNVYEVSKIR
ncbi:hypothetical protein [Flavobacterium terrisoli]|uniref:hypothetical protein n=1 Tax=Flavobacterium terrisoli TaxID=3242195 RepID=UPI00254339E0|nr:hypothetical protein [Flavobacterium buctense]